ncbi:MAG: hypothetical protein P4L72_16975 [Parvibaculum sp.]|uniref:hypothetical protein n=1 Tax=Parvibaculum sp. TaxID=2024848 RepID=UPI00283CC70D|nr:hypothetical protein [Parvibaculum sp.]MDR3500909.1 hypothetical protein [Parvibaculum sp.]
MTLIISVVSRWGIWQLSDHRLTAGGNVVSDVSMKTVRLEAEDGRALIAYSGIGKVENLEISDWVRRVLRGQRRTIDQHVHLLWEKANKSLAPICRRERISHWFSIAAYVGTEPRIYIVRYVVGFGFKIEMTPIPLPKHCLIDLAESSGRVSITRKDINDIHAIIRTRRFKPTVGKDVAAMLGRLCRKANSVELSGVSPNSIVSYLAKPSEAFVTYYQNWPEGMEKPMTSDVAGGFDVKELIQAVFPYMSEITLANLTALEEGREPSAEVNRDKMNKLLKGADFEPRDDLKE